MMADHQHVQVFVQRVDRERPCRIGRGRQYVGLATDLDDIRRMPAPGAFGMEGMDRPSLEGGNGVFDKAGFVQGVAMDKNLDIEIVGDAETGIDRRRGGAPVFMQFQRAGTGFYLFFEGLRGGSIALAEEPQVHRKRFCRLEHARQVPRPGRAGGRVGACGRTGAAAHHGRQPAVKRVIDLLRADEVNVNVETAGGNDLSFGGDRLGAGSDDDIHPRLDIGISGLADSRNPAVFQTDIGLVDARMIQDQRIGDNGIHGAAGARDLGLAHAVADNLAAAEFHFFAIDRAIVFDLDDQVRIGKADLVAGRGAEHVRIGAAVDFIGHRSALQLAVYLGVEPADHPVAGIGDKLHRARLTGLEPHRRPRRDIQPEPACRFTVEGQAGIRFIKMIVGPDLDRPVPRIRNVDPNRLAALVQCQRAGCCDDFSGYHDALLNGSVHGR